MKKYPCPVCKKSVNWSEENKYRPFCSERCQLIDLGKWANDEYKVSDDLDESEEDEGYAS